MEFKVNTRKFTALNFVLAGTFLQSCDVTQQIYYCYYY